MFYNSLDAFTRDLRSADLGRRIAMAQWAAGLERSAGQGRVKNPKARRLFRQMRQAAEAAIEALGTPDGTKGT